MKKNSIKAILSMMAAAALLIGSSLTAFAATADVTEDTVRIRSEASTSGNQVATGKKGDSYKILETVSGSDGNTWYKVQLGDGSNGYVRGDLVKVVQESSDAGNGTANEATSLAPTESTAITETTATIGGNSSVNIRSGAGTSYAKVASLDAGTSITLIAEADDSSGNKWYQFKCEAKGVEGYIRSDLITVSEEPQPAEGEAVEGEGVEGEAEGDMYAEESETDYAPPAENNDYEIVYTQDDAGSYAYYLYDHINNNRQKVNDLLGAVDSYAKKYNDAQDEIEKYKIIGIICGGVALIFLILLVVFIIKYINAANDGMYDYDDDYDDSEYDEDDEYEEEEEDDYEEPVRRREATVRPQSKITPGSRNASAAAPVRSNTSSRGTAQGAPASRSAAQSAPSSRSASRPSAARPSASRPAQNEVRRSSRGSSNFLNGDDDEFEFEFLNMDDKD